MAIESSFYKPHPSIYFFYACIVVCQPQNPDRTMARAAILAFTLGMLVEILGVNYGLIFGSYSYGENLGVKILGVPVLIGANWVMLSFITGAMGDALFRNNKLLAAISGAVLMVLIDLVIEPVAPFSIIGPLASMLHPSQITSVGFWLPCPFSWAYNTGFAKKNTPFQHILCWFTFIFWGICPAIAP